MIQTGYFNNTSSLPRYSHTLLSMSQGQKHFPGMKALIRPDRQSQQWNYSQMVQAEKKHRSYLIEWWLLFTLILIKAGVFFSPNVTSSSSCVCLNVCVRNWTQKSSLRRYRKEIKRTFGCLVRLGWECCLITATGSCTYRMHHYIALRKTSLKKKNGANVFLATWSCRKICWTPTHLLISRLKRS